MWLKWLVSRYLLRAAFGSAMELDDGRDEESKRRNLRFLLLLRLNLPTPEFISIHVTSRHVCVFVRMQTFGNSVIWLGEWCAVVGGAVLFKEKWRSSGQIGVPLAFAILPCLHEQANPEEKESQ